MKSNIKMWKLMVLAGAMLFLSDIAYAKSRTQDSVPGYKPDTGYFAKRFIHRLGVEYRPGYIFPTSSFLAGDNSQWKPFEWGYSAHLKYSFQFKPNTCADRIYGSAYQGIGVGYYDFGSRRTGKPDCRLRLSRGTHCAYHPTVVTQLRMELRCVLRLETL